MRAALREARKANEKGEIPVGAVVVKDGKIIARGYNKKEERGCAVEHAEIVAIRKACKKLGDWRLNDCDLYVTLEPCAMCAGALVNSRIRKVFYGTPDVRFGACGSVYNIHSDGLLNHSFEAASGLCKDECLGILQEFFKKLRDKPKN